MPAFYANKVSGFLSDHPEQIIGRLTTQMGEAGFFTQKKELTASWNIQVKILHAALSKIKDKQVDEWGLLIEYPIPRRGKRIDTVILAGETVVVLEFKTRSHNVNKQDIAQVEDYCLDLRDFHKESKDHLLLPILVAENADVNTSFPLNYDNQISKVILSNAQLLDEILQEISTRTRFQSQISLSKWNTSAYQPTPTIIEAAQHLYANKDVEEISRSQAGSENLTKTTEAVLEAICYARKNRKKVICFITGVPGSGKTLAGLNVVHKHSANTNTDIAAFLSGNGPLIKVLREALARDLSNREAINREEARRRVKTFIQNVHEFFDEYFNSDTKTPPDHVIVWDEAQRAWNKEHSMRKFQRNHSEPEMVFEIMDRHPDWAVIVGLIGGGQEINTGEAGLREWGRVLAAQYPHWETFISPELLQGDHATGGMTLFEKAPESVRIYQKDDLHLKVCIRSYKAEKLSKWVSAVLRRDIAKAKKILSEDMSDYPIYITRDLEKARHWLQMACRGTRRAGLICSSGALRLKRLGIDPKADIKVEKWFLEPDDDVRSSSFLELAVTEFGIQGLELDYSCVCWDADLRNEENLWGYYKFRGTKWQQVRKEIDRQYLVNKYRVLLTRAREGMIIFVQDGDQEDQTRNPIWYDGIADYLKACGIPEIR